MLITVGANMPTNRVSRKPSTFSCGEIWLRSVNTGCDGQMLPEIAGRLRTDGTCLVRLLGQYLPFAVGSRALRGRASARGLGGRGLRRLRGYRLMARRKPAGRSCPKQRFRPRSRPERPAGPADLAGGLRGV